ncbi:UDP-N-acetylmuramate dehydrogenase [Hydromonas duriensis]|uniref:UDP-N-acetylenolpyruvoylglucosamine reductase n=1 Tax=Hydromonas duriensis TaxID=1527608 RepID=A0A4R6Y5A5_9BURK|nr:UDP-N-acetylmuramate dehydrogenase [Hydromonas duriensis]TDR30521.1 UDP-N-acetylmuramate dehydrogenase [Hydromonas duriensis]
MTLYTVQHHFDLTHLNTMGFSVSAANYVPITSDEVLSAWLMAHDTIKSRSDCFVLGGGSNLVLTRDITGTVLHLQQRGVTVVDENDTHIIVSVAAGEVWHDWVMQSVENGWMGLENLALIPGSVGASPVQNIGAYGVEVKDVLESVKAWDRQAQTWVVLKHDECQFTYRDSVFKQPWLEVDGHPQSRYIITEVRFKLLKDASLWQPKISYGDVAAKLKEMLAGEPITAVDVANAIIAIRRSKLPDPKTLGNAGSFFKNPVIDLKQLEQLKLQYPNIPNYPQTEHLVKVAAGWLIEQSGFKGLRDGAVGVYDKQALVLVHHGGGTGLQLMALARRIQEAVFLKFNIKISSEPIVY